MEDILLVLFCKCTWRVVPLSKLKCADSDIQEPTISCDYQINNSPHLEYRFWAISEFFCNIFCISAAKLTVVCWNYNICHNQSMKFSRCDNIRSFTCFISGCHAIVKVTEVKIVISLGTQIILLDIWYAEITTSEYYWLLEWIKVNHSLMGIY